MIELLYLFAALCGTLIIGNILARLIGNPKVHFAFDLSVLAALAIVIAYMLYVGTNQTVASTVAINGFSLFFMLIATVGLALVSMIAYCQKTAFWDFAVMSSFSLMGAYIVASSVSIITIFIGLELMGIASVFVVIMSRKSLEASTKFFIAASLSVAMLAIASVLMYGSTGSLAISPYAGKGLLALSAVIFIAAIGVEASIFPFNILIPDIYDGSPAYATAMLGGINKKIGFAALLQVLFVVFVRFDSLHMLIAVLAAATMLYGNLAAIMQTRLKRMLAYSSIAQAGYIMIGIAVATPAGLTASLVQIFAHVFLFIGIFAIVAWLESRDRVEIDDVIGLNKESRLAAFGMTLFMLSMAGLPFTTGFIGKLLLFTSAIGGGMVWLAIVGIVNSIISIYYYARPIIAAYTAKDNAVRMKLKLPLKAAIIACIGITIIFGVYPQPLITLASHAGAVLTGLA